ncbi:MAG: hypothetical protein AB7T06_09870 [Kofleriaceae bacterium]
MKVRSNAFFPDEIVDAVLVGSPDQTSRTETKMRLELRRGATPVQLPPPDAFGTIVVNATPEEWASLRAAGYLLQQAPMHARYSFGNPYAPMGFGGYSVEVFVDGAVELIHERHGKRRMWRARAEPALWPQLASAIHASGFPRKLIPRGAPPGTASFALTVERSDGAMDEVSGFPTDEYRDVALLFNSIVGQMAKDQVFGFEPPVEIRYVSDVLEL